MAIDLFNGTCDLITKPDQTVEDNDRMMHAAHAAVPPGQSGRARDRAGVASRAQMRCSGVRPTINAGKACVVSGVRETTLRIYSMSGQATSVGSSQAYAPGRSVVHATVQAATLTKARGG